MAIWVLMSFWLWVVSWLQGAFKDAQAEEENGFSHLFSISYVGFSRYYCWRYIHDGRRLAYDVADDYENLAESVVATNFW